MQVVGKIVARSNLLPILKRFPHSMIPVSRIQLSSDGLLAKICPLEVCTYPTRHSGSQERNICCPKASNIKNCHWVGQGSCDQNNCDE